MTEREKTEELALGIEDLVCRRCSDAKRKPEERVQTVLAIEATFSGRSRASATNCPIEATSRNSQGRMACQKRRPWMGQMDLLKSPARWASAHVATRNLLLSGPAEGAGTSGAQAG
ncbi:unnamed protein product [Prorocentrum cordatum]|uniref:Uncharacterized protein n=1 Tax=Prorocentrum cordatum TaxID=2364126 RepID=A0ABN9XP90_9DINO|nr:unnamed protein product [Polarella glacialis]